MRVFSYLVLNLVKLPKQPLFSLVLIDIRHSVVSFTLVSNQLSVLGSVTAKTDLMLSWDQLCLLGL